MGFDVKYEKLWKIQVSWNNSELMECAVKYNSFSQPFFCCMEYPKYLDNLATLASFLADFYSIHVQAVNHKKESGRTDSLNI